MKNREDRFIDNDINAFKFISEPEEDMEDDIYDEESQKQNMTFPGFATSKDLDAQLESILKSIEPDVMKAIKKLNLNKNIKQNSKYLDDVADFMKLNYNCPDSEKVGSGPGSCGGSQSARPNNDNSIENILKHGVPFKDFKGKLFDLPNINTSIKDRIKTKILDQSKLAKSMKVEYFWQVSERNLPEGMQMAQMFGVLGISPNGINSILDNHNSTKWKPGDNAKTRPYNVTDFFPKDKIVDIIMDHEFGHLIYESMLPLKQETINRLFKEIVKKKQTGSSVISSPTRRGDSNPQEWIADNYACHANGRDDLVNNNLLMIFKDIEKNDVKNAMF